MDLKHKRKVKAKDRDLKSLSQSDRIDNLKIVEMRD